MENTIKKLKVSAIENGTVLDHIPANQLFKVINILNLTDCRNQVTFGTNLESKLLGKKAIIKIADRYFADDEINKITLVAPQAKINVIKNFEVVEKRILTVPSEITGIAKCSNPKCITNHQPVPTRFATVADGGHLKLQCHFCEKMTDAENVVILAKN
ncbi:MAG: aspartate carbamoyltransferase regulatory subunit [Bacteroidales bacterium]|nr:aspartate carbamoyltransferase regulatory subunit [Bacteroidales bacterium]